MKGIPADQLDRIQPLVDGVAARVADLTALLLPDDAPTAADYTLPQE